MHICIHTNMHTYTQQTLAFWYDRDTPDVTGGMNVHHFLEWLHQEDPVEKIADEFVMAGRVSFLLRYVWMYLCICLDNGFIKEIL
jgi:hypothetical protein